MEKVKVIIIGYGHLGKWHAQKASIIDQAELVAIIEPNASQMDLAKKAFPGVHVLESYDSIIDSFDAAFIVTPTSFHFDICKDLINKSKHVFCEKPITTNYTESKELKALLENTSLVFQAGHSERFHQIWEQRMDNKLISYFSSPTLITIDRYAPFKGRATDVDVVRDLMIHDLDLLLFLFSSRPLSVEAKGIKMRTDKWDFVRAFFTYAGGQRAVITVGRNHVKEKRSLEILNNDGTFYVDLFENKAFVGDTINTENFVEEISFEKRDHLYIEHESFYKAIIEKTRPIVSINDGVSAVYLVDKVLESIDLGAEVTLDKGF